MTVTLAPVSRMASTEPAGEPTWEAELNPTVLTGISVRALLVTYHSKVAIFN
jgi:hypothetical protein